MSSLPKLTVLEVSKVSPPPSTLGDKSLSLTFYDISWLTLPPTHALFLYELPLTKTNFVETIVPNLKTSLSTALQHFFPFVGNLIISLSPANKAEIRYVEGDFVEVTFADCDLDFEDLAGNHPRECDKFYHLIPRLKRTDKVSDNNITIPVFTVQVTLFPNCGFSIGITTHHSLGDAKAQFSFLKAWASIAQSGTDELFLANGNLPLYERFVKYPKLDESYRKAKIETFNMEYQPSTLLSGPTDKVRATFILTRDVINRLKEVVINQLPPLANVSSFIVACGYIWSCIAESRNDEVEMFGISIDCRSRLDPPIPEAYFGNCLTSSVAIEKTTLLTGKEGFVTAAKLIGNRLRETLNDKDGIMKDVDWQQKLLSECEVTPTTKTWVSGTPKLRFYDLDFGWGKPKKFETISLDYNGAISMNACKETNQDLEIGVCLSANEMDAFVRIFNDGVEAYI